MPKSAKGTVTVRVAKGRLTLRWTWSEELGGNGERYEMAIGLPDNLTNRKVAELKAKLIERDLAHDGFDPTLEKYRSSLPTSRISIGEMFKRFIEYKKQYVYKTTLIKYRGLSNHLEKFFKQKTAVSLGETEAVEFRDWLLKSEKLQPITVFDKLTLVSACWEWGVKRKLVASNPWGEVVRTFKVPPKQKSKPFSKAEVRAIVQGFRVDPEYTYYADFVEFFLSIGCRTGEAVALQWKHLSDDCSAIWIGESVTVDGDRKATKTNESRDFILPERVQELLKRRKPLNAKPDDAVFPSRRGKTINPRNFAKRAWKEVLGKAGIDYRRPYNSRHTIASLSIFEYGENPAKIARMLGHDPRTLFRNYLSEVGDRSSLPDVLSD
ncbi:MAG: tyrosine-type recombinase/integrase [Myxacorys chilensis ATA2-1-KO14]|jgi:integrase|nr:tyrosine-type recombinase/integrase [Myxacorys chilensis ATA2-1-KO14]